VHIIIAPSSRFLARIDPSRLIPAARRNNESDAARVSRVAGRAHTKVSDEGFLKLPTIWDDPDTASRALNRANFHNEINAAKRAATGRDDDRWFVDADDPRGT